MGWDYALLDINPELSGLGGIVIVVVAIIIIITIIIIMNKH